MEATINSNKRAAEALEDDQQRLLAASGETGLEDDSDSPTKRSRNSSIKQGRVEDKDALNKMFQMLALHVGTTVTDDLRKQLADALSSEGDSRIDINQMINASKDLALENGRIMEVSEFIQIIQRIQSVVQNQRTSLRQQKQSLPKALKNFILTTLAIVSKPYSEILSDIMKSKALVSEWGVKTAEMSDDEAAKIKINVTDITGDFLNTDNSKRAYVGMLNEENRFKSNFVHLSKFMIEHKMIAEM